MINNRSPVSLDEEVIPPLRSKENTLKIYKRYCDYQQFTLYHKLRKLYADKISEQQKMRLQVTPKMDEQMIKLLKAQIVQEVINEDDCWEAVFESVGLDVGLEKEPRVEFKRAYYTFKFDY